VALRILDSFSRRKLDFEPLVPGKVGIYLCGPTVQNSPHIGHGRSAIAFDVVRRYLQWTGITVQFVRNVTDIDDKIIARAAERGEDPKALAERYADEYNRAMAALNVLPPTVEPRVTQHIPQIISLIEKLIAKGKAYASGGDVYFSVASFPPYGKLKGQSIDELQAGARVEVGEKKMDPLDFALWKAEKPGEPSWESPWGKGRPGWHIECSAMVIEHMGDRFDIHGGGMDLIFPHHENEIAQSQAACGDGTFARYWMHNGFVNFGGEKMSKSLGNVFLIADLATRFDGESLRFYLAQHHYRSPINFEVAETSAGPVFPSLEEAERRLDYFYTTLARLDDDLGANTAIENGPVVPEADRLIPAFREGMDDDFNTTVAFRELGEAATTANRLLDDPKAAVKDVRRRSLQRLARDLRSAGGALGFFERPPSQFLHARRTRLAAQRGIVPADVDARLVEREQARKAKDFARADAIRAELREKGIVVMDTPRGADWRINE
jgi:cysteinyl-tRNA synthetase